MTQPPGPPPMPPTGDSGLPPTDPLDDHGYRLGPTPSTGGVVAFGILHIVFALICGCTNGSAAAVLAGISNADSDVFAGEEFDQQIDVQFAEQIALAESDEDRKALESLRDYLKSQEFKDAAAEAITYIASSESGGRLKMTTSAGLFAQILMLLSGALLLARVRIARALSLVATFATIGVQIAWLVFSLAVIDDVELRIMERIQEEIAEQELTQPNAPDMGFSDEVVEEIGTAFRSFTMIGTGFAILYPLIAFLVILLSRNIRRVLEGERVTANPDVF